MSWLKIELRGGFADKRALITTTLMSSCTFLVAKEKAWKCIFNTNSDLSQNHTEKQIIPSKTAVNWLFNDIWCYLFIACFDWKVGVFQQTVVRVYYNLKGDESWCLLLCYNNRTASPFLFLLSFPLVSSRYTHNYYI